MTVMRDSNTTSIIRNWVSNIPKVELHVHLEGAIPLDALWKLVEKYGGDPDVPDREALRRRFSYKSFAHFIDVWLWKNQFLRDYEDFTFIAEQVARDLRSQNTHYAEVFYSPPDFLRNGLEPQHLTEAIRQGLALVPDVRVNLVADLCRDTGPKRAAVTLAQVHEVRNQGVIGIGLGGLEAENPPEPYAPVFAEARRLGFHTSAHAGEAAGAASIWGALRRLVAERVGHATHAEEDPELLDFLAEHQVPLEMCPLSNVRTGVVTNLEAHPIRRYFERGLYVTVNSDDPKMFGNSLADEYAVLIERLGFAPREIQALILNAARASWLSTIEKRELVESLFHDPGWTMPDGI